MRRTGLLRWVSLTVVVSVFASGWVRHPDYERSPFLFPIAHGSGAVSHAQPIYQSRFVSSSVDDFAHSASIAPLRDGGLIAAWYAGSREGASDVVIRGALFDPRTGEWSEESTLVDREITEVAVHRHIRKLGNPVIAMAPDNRLWLFYVSVSVGGWALSALNAMASDDFGQSWSAPRRLITSPFLNLSTLVRAAPVFHRDGSIGLPVYHEFMGKFAEYLYLDPSGRVVDKFRISKGRDGIQPTVVPLSETSAVAMLRYTGDLPGNVLVCRTEDAGRSWSEPVHVPLRNPNSSLAVIGERNANNSILVALNDLAQGRFRLSLYQTDPTLRQWSRLAVLDQSPDPQGLLVESRRYRGIILKQFLNTGGHRHRDLADDFLRRLDRRMCRQSGCEFEYEYPYFLRSPDGRFHVVYSWNNSFIKHVSFNRAWLDSLR